MPAVVPYVGTWIEIRRRQISQLKMAVVPYVGTWIEIHNISRSICARFRRSLRGNVDRNVEAGYDVPKVLSRSLRGNVDRNSLIPFGN